MKKEGEDEEEEEEEAIIEKDGMDEGEGEGKDDDEGDGAGVDGDGVPQFQTSTQLIHGESQLLPREELWEVLSFFEFSSSDGEDGEDEVGEEVKGREGEGNVEVEEAEKGAKGEEVEESADAEKGAKTVPEKSSEISGYRLGYFIVPNVSFCLYKRHEIDVVEGFFAARKYGRFL